MLQLAYHAPSASSDVTSPACQQVTHMMFSVREKRKEKNQQCNDYIHFQSATGLLKGWMHCRELPCTSYLSILEARGSYQVVGAIYAQ